MPHTHAAAKSLSQTRKHRARNLRVLTQVRKAIHAASQALRAAKTDEAKSMVLAATKALDRAVAKGVIKKNTAARKKSRLVRALKVGL